MGVTKEIALTRITGGTDRAYGGEGNLAALAASIKRHGILNPLLVRASGTGSETYQLIAGRRRLRAAKLAGLKKAPATVLEPGEEADAAELALTENVNRLEMNPLDEAKSFADLLAKGEDVKEIALRYERSPAAIYQRARLAKLCEGLRRLFYEGKLTLSQAAVLAGLDEERQDAFLKKEGTRATISHWHINTFLYEMQQCKLEYITDEECAGCSRRTRNTDPQLFEDYKNYEDVCFDEGCWKKKWERHLASEIERAREAAGSDTRIIIYAGGGDWPEPIEALLSAEEGPKTIRLGGEEFEVRDGDEYFCDDDDDDGVDPGFPALRICSYHRPPVAVRRYREYNRGEKPERGVPIHQYLPDLPEDAAGTIAASLKEKKVYPWKFEEAVQERVLEGYIKRRGEAGKDPGFAVIDQYFAHPYTDTALLKKLWQAYTGKAWKGYSKAFKEFPAAAVFFALRASGMRHDMPGAGETDPEKLRKNTFMKFSGLTVEGYRDLVAEAAAELVKELAAAPAGAAAGEEEEEDDE
jgi:ParB/RepB/Spo0J family partition protein